MTSQHDVPAPEITRLTRRGALGVSLAAGGLALTACGSSTSSGGAGGGSGSAGSSGAGGSGSAGTDPGAGR